MSRARYHSPVIVCVDWPTTYLIIDMPCMCWKNAHVSKICAHLWNQWDKYLLLTDSTDLHWCNQKIFYKKFNHLTFCV